MPAKKAPKNVTKKAPKKTPAKAPKKTPRKTPKTTPTKAPNKTPKKAPKKAPKKTPTKAPKKAPKKTAKKSSRKAPSFETISAGTAVSWHYRSAIGHGTVTGVHRLGTTAANTMYSIDEHDHHPGEPDVVFHSGKALTRAPKTK